MRFSGFVVFYDLSTQDTLQSVIEIKLLKGISEHPFSDSRHIFKRFVLFLCESKRPQRPVKGTRQPEARSSGGCERPDTGSGI